MSEPKIPQALEAEAGILSCCFIDPESFPALLDSALEAGHFMDPRHQIIFQALSSIYERSEPMEELTISRELERAGSLRQVGGMDMLMSLAGRVETTAYLSEWIRMVKDAHVRREVMRKARSLIEDARENTEDPGVWIEKVEQEVYQIGDWARVGCHVSTGSQIVMAGDAAQMGVDAIIRRFEGKASGVPSGFHDMDNLTGGLCSPDLIILAARPSVGKTAVALQISDNIGTNQGHPVLFFSLEMSVQQLMTRAISRRASINIMRARDGMLDSGQRRRMDSAAEQISGGGLMIDDSANLHINQIRARCRRIKARRGLGLVVIDYLQLVAGDGGDRRKREEQVAFISRELKGMAKELDVPVLVLAQFNREAVKNGQRPALHNLRECLPVEEWVYTPSGPTQLKTKPNEIITVDNQQSFRSRCDFIPKKYNQVYRVRTQYGDFSATARHLVLTGTGWKMVRDLNPERDVIASPKKIPHANKGPQKHARLLGWLLGNGGFSGTPSLIYRKEFHEEVAKEVSAFGVRVNARKVQKSDNVVDTYLSNGLESGSLPNPIMKWMRELGLEGSTAHSKTIPDSYMGSSDETHRELLRGLWESDGTVTRGTAKFTTVSETMARQVVWLLLTLGIRSKATNFEYNPSLWEVRVAIADNERMSGICSNPVRFGKLQTCSEWYVDPAPAIFTELAAEIYSGSERLQKRTNGQFKAISKQRMKQITESIELPSIEISPYMRMENIGWGRIDSIEKQDGDVRVCDLSVPGTHNFISNGIVVHNSGAIEQDADVAILMSADNPEEDARASERKILFDLAKQRNGPVGYWKLIFETNFQRFREEGMEVAGEEEAARPVASSWHKDPTPPEREPASVFSSEPEEEEEPLF